MSLKTIIAVLAGIIGFAVILVGDIFGIEAIRSLALAIVLIVIALLIPPQT